MPPPRDLSLALPELYHIHITVCCMWPGAGAHVPEEEFTMAGQPCQLFRPNLDARFRAVGGVYFAFEVFGFDQQAKLVL